MRARAVALWEHLCFPWRLRVLWRLQSVVGFVWTKARLRPWPRLRCHQHVCAVRSSVWILCVRRAAVSASRAGVHIFVNSFQGGNRDTQCFAVGRGRQGCHGVERGGRSSSIFCYCTDHACPYPFPPPFFCRCRFRVPSRCAGRAAGERQAPRWGGVPGCITAGKPIEVFPLRFSIFCFAEN